MDPKIIDVTCKTLTVDEAAAILGISRAKAYDAARRGDLPSIRFGRRIVIPTAALEQLLDVRPSTERLVVSEDQ
jgi:excisionase family DNA binding protein